MRMNKAVLILLGNFEGHNGGEWTAYHAHLSYIQEQLKLSNKQDSNSNDIVRCPYSTDIHTDLQSKWDLLSVH